MTGASDLANSEVVEIKHLKQQQNRKHALAVQIEQQRLARREVISCLCDIEPHLERLNVGIQLEVPIESV